MEPTKQVKKSSIAMRLIKAMLWAGVLVAISHAINSKPTTGVYSK